MKTYNPCLCFCLFLMCAGLAAAEFVVDSIGEPQQHPDIDGSIVVWSEYIPQYDDYDILGIDLEGAAGYIHIISLANDQTRPRISGSRVAWQDDFYGDGSDYDIYLSDISSPDGILLYPVAATPDLSESNPAVHGDTIVWQALNDTPEMPGWNIFGADVADPNFPFYYKVDTLANDQTHPAVWRNRVVYQDYAEFEGEFDWDLWSADVWLKKDPRYDAVSTAIGSDEQRPAVWGDVVVFEQQTAPGNTDIFAADMSDPANPQITIVTDAPADQTAPDIDRHIVVYQDNRNAETGWDIYGYNLITKREFRITDNAADQTNPAVSGDTVVWQDTRGDAPTIWAAYLDPVDIADCLTPLAADINDDCKVNIHDFISVADSWLACNLDPPDACTD